MKTCTKCQTEKQISDFYKRKASTDGHSFLCKLCDKLYQQTRYGPELREAHRQYRQSVPEKGMLWNASRRAKALSLPFNLELNDIIIPQVCPYLGTNISSQQGKGRVESNPSLDRIIPELGYVKGNIEVISDKANRMKNNASIKELQTFATNILNRWPIDNSNL